MRTWKKTGGDTKVSLGDMSHTITYSNQDEEGSKKYIVCGGCKVSSPMDQVSDNQKANVNMHIKGQITAWALYANEHIF